jgi:epoxide hydrolase-like predicted phosphatase
MIKAVLFDYGGVLTEGGKSGSIQANIAQLCDRPFEDVDIRDLHAKFIRGHMTEAEFFEAINHRYPCAKPITGADFVANSTLFGRCKPVYELARQLREAGLKTGILSNIYDMSATKLRSEGFYRDFDPVLLSYEHGMAKPDVAFFELALEKLGLTGPEVLFIDDQQRFKKMTNKVGMHFILAVTPGQIVQDTKALVHKQNGIVI